MPYLDTRSPPVADPATELPTPRLPSPSTPPDRRGQPTQSPTCPPPRPGQTSQPPQPLTCPPPRPDRRAGVLYHRLTRPTPSPRPDRRAGVRWPPGGAVCYRGQHRAQVRAGVRKRHRGQARTHANGRRVPGVRQPQSGAAHPL